MADPGIIRNQAKIEATIKNARAFLEAVEKTGSFDRFLWQFVGGEPRINHWQAGQQIPADTAESKAMSKELKRRGFGFVGSTICYAFMQAVGMVDDHLATCFRRLKELLPPRHGEDGPAVLLSPPDEDDPAAAGQLVRREDALARRAGGLLRPPLAGVPRVGLGGAGDRYHPGRPAGQRARARRVPRIAQEA